MIRTPLLAAAAAITLLLQPAAVSAKPAAAAADAPVREADLMQHIRTLAGDAFQGRAPGSEGEMRTIAYLTGTLAQAGFRPVADSATPWLQPVPLVESRSLGGTAHFHHGGRAVAIEEDGVLLAAKGDMAEVKAAPVAFVGYGVDADGRVTADVAGKVVVMLFDNPPFGTDLPRYRERRRLLGEAGARAVLIVAGEALPWASLRGALGSSTTRLAAVDSGPDIAGFLSAAAFDALMTRAGQSADAASAAAASPDYRGTDLGITADLTARSEVRRFDSHNVLAKLPGARPDGRAVLLLGHWDHLGICAPDSATDRICNGAVDNASGIAVLLEVARRLGAGPRPDRDIYLLATTAEERGLLGAHYFADHPVVPLDAITVALNVDTIAISPRGTPVAVIGRGKGTYDALVADVATGLGRTLDPDGEADAFVQRQDGWALGAKGVVSLMAGGSFSDMGLLQAFLAGPYHKPGDDLSRPIELGGAAEDADLHVALARAFASRKRWAPAAAAAAK